jgi:hypothetical protein
VIEQPTALRLADALDCRGPNPPDWRDQLDAASELRRLHQENERLKNAVTAMAMTHDKLRKAK